MTTSVSRRRIDWDVLLPGQPRPATLAQPTMEVSQLAALTAEVMAAPSPATLDRVLMHAVEFGRVVIGLERTAIFLLDDKKQVMVGTFGTGEQGQTVDEHALTYQYGDIDREVFTRAELGYPWTVYDDCPQIAQSQGSTSILGRGWVACTAIRGPRGPLGIFFNDTAISHAQLDEAKQSHAAILCSMLGRALEPCRSFLVQKPAALSNKHGIVQGVNELLVRDPSLSCDALARDLNLSPRRLTRAFKREAQRSIVDYRNEVRLTRFFERVDASAHNLLEAALEAGFGSYAQFHRVFRARFGQSPREYLLEAQREARA